MTGRVEEEPPNPMEGMTEEQKEHEAMKLVNMFDKLSRYVLCQGGAHSWEKGEQKSRTRVRSCERQEVGLKLGLARLCY